MTSQFSWAVDPIFGCFLWTGRTDKRDGRAIVWRGKTPSSAQRAVYEQEIGPIPEGMELDHTCRDLRCVRPAHAEPVTRVENERRKSWRHRARIAKCKNGHDLKVNAMVTPNGGRVCRACSRSERP
jgi:hypothetical protein